MDFGFTEEQVLLRRSVREFADSQVAPEVARMEESGKPPLDLIRKMGEMGYVGVAVPTEQGGSGLGHLARIILLEEIARVSAAAAVNLEMLHVGLAPILDFGSQEQQERYLPGLIAGKLIPALAVTEPSGGSDPASATTTAVRDGDNWVLNGRKCFITNAHIADVATVLARSGEGPKGFSAFLVARGTPGFRATREEQKVGLRGCNTGELVFEQCTLPRDALLGKEGDGLKVALKSISEIGRGGMAACALGVLQACIDASRKFAKERHLYGAPISGLQAIQFKIAEMALDLEAARLLCYRAAWLKDRGQRCDLQFAQAKLFATEAAVAAAKKTMDIHGGYGCMMDFPAQRLYRDAQVLIPSSGTSDVMKLLISRAALG